jgi:hypothetical protein
MANASGQYQLTNVEAQRICAVLDELVVDLRLAFCVTPLTLSETSDIAGLVGQDNERFFVMQLELEKQFCVLGKFPMPAPLLLPYYAWAVSPSVV